MSNKDRIIRFAMAFAGSFILAGAIVAGWDALTANPIKLQQLNDALDWAGEGLQLIQEAIPLLTPLL